MGFDLKDRDTGCWLNGIRKQDMPQQQDESGCAVKYNFQWDDPAKKNIERYRRRTDWIDRARFYMNQLLKLDLPPDLREDLDRMVAEADFYGLYE